MRVRGDRVAFGAPGIDPRWSHGNKEGVGTAYSQDSKLWFTLFRGVVTEVYYPLIDHPQLRDLQFLVTDGSGRFLEERHQLESYIERFSDHALGYRLRNRDPQGRFTIHKEVIASPHLACLLQRCRLEDHEPGSSPLSLYLLAAPHLDVGGFGNNAYVVELPGRTILAAERNGTWLALGASVPFRRSSVGYVGASDGWTDLDRHRSMTFEFDRAPEGNVALTGELDVSPGREFTVALAFGLGLTHAATTLLQALGADYGLQRERYQEQWDRVSQRLRPLVASSRDGGNLLHSSYSLLLAHEDKSYPGAFIASLSIPWGQAKGDADRGGYHLVWTRDLVQAALGLLAAGDHATPLRTLAYLIASQSEDGGFAQNFWLDGTPYWRGVQLDEVALPILLAFRLDRAKALGELDPYPMVLAGARFLLERGPATEQDRWEEVGGYSPSTLAAVIAALIGGATMAREREDPETAELLAAYADFLEAHLERWTFTTQGTLLPGTTGHYIRILPIEGGEVCPREDPNTAEVRLPNLADGSAQVFPARTIVDGGFLELVRYGIRSPDDPRIVDSLKVVDATLRVETPNGPAWHRYPHDGYGDRDDGGPYDRWGVGRAWPLLTGERGHYELAAGRDPAPYLRALERFAGATGLLPEQVWDAPDLPSAHLYRGRPTGAARPLVWAHAEYLNLLRSTHDGRVFDRIPEVHERYKPSAARGRPEEFWTPARAPTCVDAGARLWVLATEPFRLHGSSDGWRTTFDVESLASPTGLHVAVLADLPTRGTLRFTRYWTRRSTWEGWDHAVEFDSPATR